MINPNQLYTKKELANHISTFQQFNLPKVNDLLCNENNLSVLPDIEITNKIVAFNIPTIILKEPKLSQWEYLDEKSIQKLLNIKNKADLEEFIALSSEKIKDNNTKYIFIKLISDVIKFCKKYNFNNEKCGCVLSQFYLTHLYFTGNIDVSPLKVYLYFKNIMMCHSLPFPPSSKKIFTIKETTDILGYFYRIYLRNLPLIQYLCKPNYALYLNYDIQPPIILNIKEKEKKPKKNERKKGNK
ncbi:hypothetical protein GWI33_002532 [Rhynchophorus ferrugineus]|uniref:Uncharacterized protein n=1 Tax=Rhynchophorus ferrugineus TaxID=354439 RepID=A0A834MLL3_RHYFE|nr:hypothetical protein GWI33_002532 [Rhynchophorus ferrugineus]